MVLRVRELSRRPAPQAWRLLRLLLIRHAKMPAGSSGSTKLLFRALKPSLMVLGYEEDRGPNMMTAIPAKVMATPTQSVVVGRMPSTAQSQRMATPT